MRYVNLKLGKDAVVNDKVLRGKFEDDQKIGGLWIREKIIIIVPLLIVCPYYLKKRSSFNFPSHPLIGSSIVNISKGKGRNKIHNAGLALIYDDMDTQRQ